MEIGGTAYQFHSAKLMLSSPNAQANGKRMFRLSGSLVPAHGESIAMELTSAETGAIYLLKLTRPRGNGQDIWAATMKTKVEVLELQASPGGALRLKLSGPLVAALESGGSFTRWSGEIQARFDVISGRNETH
ncbi:MAG: hypothetical protein KGN80_09120 [Acidobacteriota bacterium]|nr:hypothetical protein [Acidobacteriota bacterium]